MAQEYKRRHFHTFDALRFFAFFKVFLLHLPHSEFPIFNFLKAGGGIGVQFFFVLSGFLITYISLEEKERTGNLNLRNFFARRVLRIWPLYYLMLVVAFITPYVINNVLNINTSAEGYEPNWLMSITFLENYKMMFTNEHPNVSPLGVMWSLCIEEHFYIIWGLLLCYIGNKHLPKIIIASIITAITCRWIYLSNDIQSLDIFTNIDLFAYGTIPAYLLITYKQNFEDRIRRIPILSKYTYISILLSFVTICSQYTKDQYLFLYFTPLLGLSFSILIALFIPQGSNFKIKDTNIISRLGLYTYGLYLYHTPIITVLYQTCKMLTFHLTTPFQYFIFTLVVFTLTVIASAISYHLFEKQFLKLKKHFRAPSKRAMQK